MDLQEQLPSLILQKAFVVKRVLQSTKKWTGRTDSLRRQLLEIQLYGLSFTMVHCSASVTEGLQARCCRTAEYLRQRQKMSPFVRPHMLPELAYFFAEKFSVQQTVDGSRQMHKGKTYGCMIFLPDTADFVYTGVDCWQLCSC